MARDYTLEVRRAVVSHLRDSPAVTALVSRARIYGEQAPSNPEWPFIRYGSSTLPFSAQCWDGSTHLVDVHVFANGPYTDSVLNIAAAVVEALDGLEAPAGTGLVDCEWDSNIGPLRDSPETEQAKYHVVVRFNVTVAA